MRIIITGFIVLVIWSVFSMWLYVDILKPATKQQPVAVQPAVDERQAREADSLMKFYASMPKDLVFYFGFDRVRLEADQQTDSRIAEFADWMAKNPGYMLSVTGHADFIGTPEYNQDLGMQRARAVTDYLVSKGIPAERIITESKGNANPVAAKFPGQERAKNRRTEVTIKK